MIPRVHPRWNREHLVARGACDPGIFRAADLDPLLTGRRLHWPYLSLVDKGVRPPLREFSLGIRGAGQRPVVPQRVVRSVQDGCTIKLQRVEDFVPAVRDEVVHLQREFGTVTTCFAFITPAESQGLAFHRDASHVLVVQVEGTKNWTIVRPASPPGSDVGPVDPDDGERVEFTLEAGDALYLPHGWTHCATTESGRSTHLTFTMTEPDPYMLAGEIQLAVARVAAERARAGEPVDVAAIAHDLDPKDIVASALERHGL